MPRLIRLYIVQSVIGFALSSVFVGLLLWQNVANLHHLVTNTDAGMLAVFLLWLFNGLVFAGVQFAITIMRMGGTDVPPAGGKRERLALQPVRVRVEAPTNALQRRRRL